MSDPSVTIYHNPACQTSRNTLAMIRNAGIEPVIVEYLKTPLSRAQLVALGLPARELLRAKEKLAAELGLKTASDDEILDAIAEHPILFNRPVVTTRMGTKLCRPSELVLDILPAPQAGAFTKEDGEPVVDASGHRI